MQPPAALYLLYLTPPHHHKMEAALARWPAGGAGG
jgi:hypothetical protein